MLFTIDWPDDLHRKLKKLGLAEGTTMRDIVISAVREYIERTTATREKKAGGPVDRRLK